MSALDWLLWAALVWAAWFAYCAIDAPALAARAAHRLADRLHHGGAR